MENLCEILHRGGDKFVFVRLISFFWGLNGLYDRNCPIEYPCWISRPESTFFWKRFEDGRCFGELIQCCPPCPPQKENNDTPERKARKKDHTRTNTTMLRIRLRLHTKVRRSSLCLPSGQGQKVKEIPEYTTDCKYSHAVLKKKHMPEVKQKHPAENERELRDTRPRHEH